MGTHTYEASIQIDSSLYKLCLSASVGPLSFIYTSGLVRRRDSRPTGANRLDLELGPMWQGDAARAGERAARRSGQGSARVAVQTRGHRVCANSLFGRHP
jgi:hypothetical protein